MKSNGSHVCLTCGRNFKHRSHANRHYKTIHLKATKAKCHVCHKEFKNDIYRDAHRMKAHRISKQMMRQSKQSAKVPKVERESDEE